MKNRRFSCRSLWVVLMFIGQLLGACRLSAPEPTATLPPPPPTETKALPTNTVVPPTETPVPPTETPEPTLTPTETFTPTPDLVATANYESTQAAAAMLEKVYGVLDEIGYSTDSGRLIWSSADMVDLRINTYNTYDWWQIDDGKDFADFILHADITWESTSGLAICGFVVRGGENLTQEKYYLFQTIRLSGLPSWDVELWEYNKWVSTVSGTIRSAPVIDQDNGATNEFILVADGSTMVIHANGSKLGSVPITSISEGTVAYYAWSESGETSCAFSNAWLWSLEN